MLTNRQIQFEQAVEIFNKQIDRYLACAEQANSNMESERFLNIAINIEAELKEYKSKNKPCYSLYDFITPAN